MMDKKMWTLGPIRIRKQSFNHQLQQDTKDEYLLPFPNHNQSHNPTSNSSFTIHETISIEMYSTRQVQSATPSHSKKIA
jgi:hypothetical protein